MSRRARFIPAVALGDGAEFDLIRGFLSAGADARSRGVLVGPGDDCAVVRGPRLALTTDLAIEGVHFRRAWLTAEEIGYRAAAAALSDLAAVAATPVGLLVSLAVCREDAGAFAQGVMAGVTAAGAEAGAALLGGDLSRSHGPLVLDVVGAGAVGEPVLRQGAVPGDAMWVTGRLGGAAAAVAAWMSHGEPVVEARAAYARPPLRHREARWLAQRGLLHAMIDISDGLAGDAAHMAAASGARIVIEADAVPVHEGAGGHATRASLDLALHGGEDYELLFAASERDIDAVAADFAREFRTPLTRVGYVHPGQGVALRQPDGTETEAGGGFDHFSQDAG